jgi:hypothetical protein
MPDAKPELVFEDPTGGGQNVFEWFADLCSKAVVLDPKAWSVRWVKSASTDELTGTKLYPD